MRKTKNRPPYSLSSVKGVSIFFDGACHNLAGQRKNPYGIGIAMYVNGKRRHIKYSKIGGFGTSNIAEFDALLEALKQIMRVMS